jgi:DNA-directed RNA polymerase specialized sigma24 family protein
MFDRLDRNDRLILLLHYVDQLALPEMSVLLRLPEATVAGRLAALQLAAKQAINTDAEVDVAA